MNVIDERYVNGKIYKIVCNLTGEVYYGSTIQKLNDRMNKHRYNKNCESKQIINRNNYYCELIENYSCNNKNELESRERCYIENYDCINKNIPTRTKKEYFEKNKDQIVEYKKNHHEQNKEIYNERRKIHYHQNKEISLGKKKEKITCDICGSIVRRGGISKHRRTKFCLSKIDSKNPI